ncbi:MAG: flavin reductase family protein [Clostridium sp.]|uniref:flavin reductase family protein n=1 Tax=Clostridium sp. TaxID=1506 RepID=UPI0039EAA5C5
MSNFTEIKPEELNKNLFQIVGTDWMLVTAEKDNKVNTMTASWGGFGVMWGKNVAHIVIRPQRYTKEFIDNSSSFSLSVLDKSFKKQLGYLGTVSGRDEDKISKANLTIEHSDDTPYFEEANLVFICKKLYAQEFKPEFFIESELDTKWYPDKDYHTLYIAEIEKVLIKE